MLFVFLEGGWNMAKKSNLLGFYFCTFEQQPLFQGFVEKMRNKILKTFDRKVCFHFQMNLFNYMALILGKKFPSISMFPHRQYYYPRMSLNVRMWEWFALSMWYALFESSIRSTHINTSILKAEIQHLDTFGQLNVGIICGAETIWIYLCPLFHANDEAGDCTGNDGGGDNDDHG